jgi:hypothetical protein
VQVFYAEGLSSLVKQIFKYKDKHTANDNQAYKKTSWYENQQKQTKAQNRKSLVNTLDIGISNTACKTVILNMVKEIEDKLENDATKWYHKFD